MKFDLTKQFYDDLSDDYHLNYLDWDIAISKQCKILDKIIKLYGNPGTETLLDYSCGIGTQSIGLARLGYQVTASDLSPLAILRAKKEALKRGAKIKFLVADFLSLDVDVVNTFDVVISCDNSLTHLLAEGELQLAAKNIFKKLHCKGLFIATIKDYDDLLMNKPLSTFPVITESANIKTFTIQTWDWIDEKYTL